MKYLDRFNFSKALLFLNVLTTSTKVMSGGVELHAHLFMKEGMSWFFNGDFNGPIRATSWKDRFSSQANPELLEKSDLNIVVATLYAHPFLTLSLRDSIRRQILLAKNFVKDHPQWILATRPKDAENALQNGKRVMILALEGAAGILESEEDLVEFVDQGGIRIVTLLHLTDDLFGGVAFLKGYRAIASPIAFFESLLYPLYSADDVRVNRQGLKDRGKEMMDRLIRHHVWIDLAHSSDHSQDEMIPILKKQNLPLLYTHTVLRKYHKAERGVSDQQLQEVARSGGYIGIIPSEEMLEGTLEDGKCKGGIKALALQYKEVAEKVGEKFVGLGSDYNGGLPHLMPGCGGGDELNQEGLWNIGQSKLVWRALREANVLHSVDQGLSHAMSFVDVWKKLW